MRNPGELPTILRHSTLLMSILVSKSKSGDLLIKGDDGFAASFRNGIWLFGNCFDAEDMLNLETDPHIAKSIYLEARQLLNADAVPKHIQGTLAVYNEQYENAVYMQDMTSRTKLRIRSHSGLRTCRYCHKNETQTGFKTDCHALLESMGNRRLFSDEECDECNQFFGRTIEDHFGKWSLPFRTVSCIKGKHGYPKMARDPFWRIESSAGGLNVWMLNEWKIGHVNFDRKTITLELLRDPYIPIAVYKTFMRMALAIMPRDEIENFRELIDWIRREDHAIGGPQFAPVLCSKIPQWAPPDTVAVTLSRRFTNDCAKPYMVFVLMFSNYVFQTCLPSPKHLQNENITVTFSPLLYGPDPARPLKPKVLDLSAKITLRNDSEPFVLDFHEYTIHHTSLHERISTRAYFLWLERGQQNDDALTNWAEAERQVRKEVKF